MKISNQKGDMCMKRQYENNGKTFWEDIDSIMSMKSEQYKELDEFKFEVKND